MTFYLKQTLLNQLSQVPLMQQLLSGIVKGLGMLPPGLFLGLNKQNAQNHLLAKPQE